jgi:hypothetical protein
MEELKFVGGCVPDPIDARDLPATMLLVKEVPLPESYIVDSDTIIYDQNGYPRCVAHGASGVKTDEEFLERATRIKFDADWLYARCKEIDGIPFIEGTFPRAACKVLNQQGCKVLTTASTCPFRFLKPKPPEPTPADIAEYKIDAYYRIDPKSTTYFIKQIILQFGSLLTASYWFSNWMAKFYTFPAPNDDYVGNHCYRTVGWNPVGFVIVNSYGKILWGRNGVATMPYAIFADVLAQGDCWKLVDHKAG